MQLFYGMFTIGKVASSSLATAKLIPVPVNCSKCATVLVSL